MGREFDYGIIGSSPISLAAALKLNKSRGSSIVFEYRDQTGGAWSTFSTNTYSDIEFGAHIMGKDPDVFNFFNDLCNIDLIEMFPEPQIIYKSKWYSNNDIVWFVFDVKTLIMKVFGFKFKEIWRSSSNILSYYPSITMLWLINKKYRQSKYLYPKRGMSDALLKILETLEEKHIPLMLNTRVSTIKLKNNYFELDLLKDNDFEIIRCKNIVLTKYCEIENISIDSIEYRVSYSRRFYYTLFLEVPAEHVKIFSYLAVLDSSNIMRISDISNYVDHIKVNSKIRLISIELKTHLSSNKIDLKKISMAVKSELVDYGIIHEKSLPLIKEFIHTYSRKIYDLNYLYSLIPKNYRRSLHIINSSSFTKGIKSVRKNFT